MTQKEWKTLVESVERSEAEVIKSALDALGIHAELFQEGAGAVYGFSVGILGDVEICVPEDEFERAQAWLESYENNLLEDNIDEHGNLDQ